MEALLFISLIILLLYQRYRLKEAKEYAQFLEGVDRDKRAALLAAKLALNDTNLYLEQFQQDVFEGDDMEVLTERKRLKNKTLAGNKKVIEQINNLNQ